MKKTTKSTAILLALLLLVSQIFIGAMAENEPAVVQGKNINIVSGSYSSSQLPQAGSFYAGKATLGEHYTADNDQEPLVKWLPSDRLTYTWNPQYGNSIADAYAVEAYKNQAIYRCFYTASVNNNSTFSGLDGLVDLSQQDIGFMFYIKLGKTAEETKLYTELQTVGFDENGNIKLNGENYAQGYVAMADSTALFLTDGTDKWFRSDKDVTLGVGPKSNYKAITIPAGFEGWVYIPNETLVNKNAIANCNLMHRVNLYFDKITTENVIEISNLMTVLADINTVKNSVGIKVNSTTYNFAQNRCYFANSLSFDGFTNSHGGFYDIARKEEQLAQYYKGNKFSYCATVGENKSAELLGSSKLSATPFTITGFTNSNLNTISVSQLSEGRGRFEFSSASGYQTMMSGNTLFASNGFTQDSTDKTLLFYVNHKNATEEINFNILFNWYSIGTNKEYYTYNANEAVWKKSVTTASGYNSVQNLSSDSSYLTLPAEFTGWVMLPANSLRTNVTELKNFRFSVYNLGGAAGSLVIGDFTLIDDIDPAVNTEALNNSVFVSTNSIALGGDFPFAAADTVAAVKTERTSDYRIYQTSNLNQSNITISVSGKTATLTATQKRTEQANSSGEISYDGTTKTQHYYVQSNEMALTKNGSIMFYVKNDTADDYKFVTGSNLFLTAPNKPYYLLDNCTDKWMEKSTGNTEYKLWGRTIAPITIPKGFEGLVSIPLTSIYSDTGCLNDSTTNGAFTKFNDFTVLTAAMDVGTVTFSDISAATTVAPTHFINGASYEGVNGNISTVTEKVTGNVSVANGVFTNENNVIYSSINAKGTVAEGGAIMLYIKTEGKCEFTLSVGDMSNVKAYATNRQGWIGVSTDGMICLPANFEGWVKIPVSKTLSFSRIKFYFNSLANGLSVSDIMSVNTSDDLDIINIDFTGKTALFYKQGDFNNDGSVNILDLIILKKHMANETGDLKFDLDGDDLIDAKDIAALRKHLLGAAELRFHGQNRFVL